MRTFAAIIALVSTSALVAQGTIIAVSWGGTSTLIDSTTGIATPLGPSGTVSLNAMAGDPTTGIIYAVRSVSATSTGPATIYTINPSTGAATSTGVTLTVTDVRGLAFNASGTLYAIVNGVPDSLYTIDLLTGVATLIGATGNSSIQALACDASGAFFGWAVNGGSAGNLLSINPMTGTATVIGPGIGGIQALGFSPTGILYGAQNALYTINPATGITAQVGAGGYNDIRGIEFTNLVGTVTFSPSNGQVTPGGGLAVIYTAPMHANEMFVPVVSCATGTTPIPGLPSPLQIGLDACTDFYFGNPAALGILPLSGTPGSYIGTLDANGIANGFVLPPAGLIPPGLNLPVHITYVTAGPNGFGVQGVGTFILN